MLHTDGLCTETYLVGACQAHALLHGANRHLSWGSWFMDNARTYPVCLLCHFRVVAEFL